MKMKRTLTVIVAIAATMSLAVASAAEAHVLPSKIANKAARKLGKRIGQAYVDENPNRAPATYQVDRCSRRTAHRFVCKLHLYGNDSDTGQDYDCHAYIIVQASKYSYTYKTKVTGIQPC